MANYLYNGIELPALPEWDREVYPYAVIAEYMAMGGLFGYDLVISDKPLYMTANSLWTPHGGCVSRYVKCYTTDIPPEEHKWNTTASVWLNPYDSAQIGARYWGKAVWANYDVGMADGNIYPTGEIGLYASDPVPVGGEPESVLSWQKHDAYKPNAKWDGHTFYKVIGNKWVKHDGVVPAE